VRPARRRGEQRAGQQERERGPLERHEGVEHGPPERVEDQQRSWPPRRQLLLLLRVERSSGAVEVGAKSGDARRGPVVVVGLEAAAGRERERARGGEEASGLEEGGGGHDGSAAGRGSGNGM
jgi:hypothetical protein